jgi:hypothetical protein
MFGEYLGQFLAISGGTMTGAITTSTDGINLDSGSDIYADGNGNAYLEGGSLWFDNPNQVVVGSSYAFATITPNLALSGNYPTCDLYINSQTSGSSTGGQYSLAGGANVSSFASAPWSIKRTGDFKGTTFTGTAFSGTSFSCATGNMTAKAFIPNGFSAAQLIYVDGVNGSDASGTGNGSSIAPFKTLPHAVSVATSGQCIFLLPGTYTVTASVTLPNGVHLAGCGIGITTVNTTSGIAILIVPGNGSMIQDLTLNSGSASVPPIGFVQGSTQVSSSFTIKRCDMTGYQDGLFLLTASGTGSTTFLCEDTYFRSGYDTVQLEAVSSWPLSGTFRRCHFYCTQNGTSGLMRCVTGTSAYSSVVLDDSDFNVIDSGMSSYSGQQYYFINGASGLTAAVRASTFIQNTPNYSQPMVAGWPTTAGAGNTLQLILSGGTSVSQLPETAATATVSSSAVTPSLCATSEIASDAGSLSSNTLSVNAIPFNTANGNVPDGFQTTLRVKNTNSGSTAMTLNFNSAYNASAFTLGTIAAGKRAYFDFVYDADNGKWDLTGYVNGV